MSFNKKNIYVLILLSFLATCMFSSCFIVTKNNYITYECGFLLNSMDDVLFQKEIYKYEEYNMKAGDVIADVGGGNGAESAMLSVFYDSLIFYIQDIDTNCLNQHKLDDVLKHYSKIKGDSISNKFHIVIGEEKKTNLPDNTFDKIIMKRVVDHLRYPDEIFSDIWYKLKDDGTLVIINTFHFEKNKFKKRTTVRWVVSTVERNGFKLIKKIDTIGKFKILIFEKVKQKD